MMRSGFLFLVATGLAATLTAADDPAWDEMVQRAALDYHAQLVAATQELAATRGRIANERLPFEERQREVQNRILALETGLARLAVEDSQADARRGALRAEVDGLNRNLGFLASLGKDTMDGLADALLPGESPGLQEPIAGLAHRWADPTQRQDAGIAVDAAELVLHRLRAMIGGKTAPGVSLLAGGNELTPGTFLWVGPEVFFRTDHDGVVGTVRQPEGATEPIVYPIPDDIAAAMTPVFRGEPGSFSADPSGGKALELHDVRGTWTDHIAQGGPIGYIIIALGALAVVTALVKIFDLRRLAVNAPEQIQAALTAIAAGPADHAGKVIAALRPTCRELFRTGASHLDQTKEALEESLYATLLRLRMQFERRLAFLTVIVAAAPLLGLLGTVTGMVKTFTLIHVFGTGNAAKLSSGISEALVTTELGLIVAIPTLVLHGYLSRTTQRNLALLERYSAEFVAMATLRQTSRPTAADPAR